MTASVAALQVPLRIQLPDGGSVAGELRQAEFTEACFVFAHGAGAGAGMDHPFMAEVAAALAGRGIGTLRFQFPYMEHGRKRPDRPAVAHDTVRAAVAEASRRLPGIALFAGGKSFGGRMTSQAQAQQPLAQVQGLVFVGFPLHPAGKPSTGRAAHLAQVQVPMLFLQGTRDTLADLALIRTTAAQLGRRATLQVVDDADHAFHVPARSGRTDAQVVQDVAARVARWIADVVASPR